MTISSKENLGKLIPVSKIDEKIFNLERIKKQIPVRYKKINQKLNSIRKSYNDLIQENEIFKSKSSLCKKEIDELENKLNESKSKIYDIKSNTAYKMALKDIESWEKGIKEREDMMSKIMETMKRNKREIDLLKAKSAPDEMALLKEVKECDKNIKDIDNEIESHYKNRKQYLKDIDDSIFSQYERLRKAKQGLALLEVKDNHCVACNIGIRPQLQNQLLAGNVVRCTNCGRLLFHHDPLH